VGRVAHALHRCRGSEVHRIHVFSRSWICVHGVVGVSAVAVRRRSFQRSLVTKDEKWTGMGGETPLLQHFITENRIDSGIIGTRAG
jgi:hypothetical protein